MKIYLSTGKVKKEWTDYNGHMNLAFYIHLFDAGWEVMLNKFNMGEQAAKTEKKTTFAVESHTTYDQEVKEGDEVDINLLFLDSDKKRLVYKLEMTHKNENYRAATTEVCSLYVDLSKRKVAEFEPLKKQKINDFIQENKINFEEKDLKLLSKLKK
ncbi:thioesterase family protein [Alphaproteobacteria bacterium]|nr:thioesterase family protein [Alphaproteobacteria bacterium]